MNAILQLFLHREMKFGMLGNTLRGSHIQIYIKKVMLTAVNRHHAAACRIRSTTLPFLAQAHVDAADQRTDARLWALATSRLRQKPNKCKRPIR